MKPEIDPNLLRELVDYDPDTGLFVWRERGQRHIQGDQPVAIWNSQWAGKPAFTTPTDGGYLRGSIFNVDYKAHRVAWAIHHGVWPENEIDHINRVKTDNRMCNLRDVDRQTNQDNMEPQWDSYEMRYIGFQRGRFRVRIRIRGKRRYFGSYETIEKAKAARDVAEKLKK
ncbi:MAG: HNH endonuclease signature motif containing protein [Hyphomonas sp.]|uniref:HNH endonuclease signature motif containing protein n=1 Tax=Hyphomonas sp. TaxID=87 RepID=UPI003262E071